MICIQPPPPSATLPGQRADSQWQAFVLGPEVCILSALSLQTQLLSHLFPKAI